MIGKLIRMKHRTLPLARTSDASLSGMKHSVIGLTRYVVDAHPERLKRPDANVIAITDYALEAEMFGAEPGEKVEAYGARNLVGSALRDWQMQMLAVVASAPRVQDPILHIILSLRESESWTATQREESIDIVARTMGLDECQLIWSEHGNTANPHLHLAIVPIDPKTGKKAGGGWPIDDLHQALALIDERHGRVREDNALYEARDGEVYDVETGLKVRTADGLYLNNWRNGVPEAGHKRSPAPDRVSSMLIDIAANAKSWSEMHSKLATHHIRYDRSGSGARVLVAERSFKASSIHRSLSRKELEKKFGVFEPDLSRLDAAYEAFCNGLTRQLAELRKERDVANKSIHIWASGIINDLNASKTGMLRKAVREEEAAAQLAVQDIFRRAIKQCTDQRLPHEKWVKAGKPFYKEVPTPMIIRSAGLAGDERPWSCPNLTERHIGWSTEYLDNIGEKLFTDHRVIIIVHASDRIDAMDAALSMGAARWGSIRVTGSPQFIALAAERAQKLGIEMIASDVARAAPARPPAPVSLPIRPIPQPSRQISAREKLLEALAILRRHPLVPLRRMNLSPGTHADDRNGMLEIASNLNMFSRDLHELQKVSHLVQHPEVQAALEKSRLHLLSALRAKVETDDLVRMPESKEDLLALLPIDDPIRPAVSQAYGDRDLEAMLADVRASMMKQLELREATSLNLAAPTNETSADEDLYLQQLIAMQGRSLGR
jgi:hypothetical protein